MKKILSLSLILTLILGAICIFPASAEHISAHKINCGDFWYAPLGNGNATVGAVSYDLSGNIVIPETLDGYTITEIAHSGFTGTKITGVVIPDTVTRLGDYAFSYCPNLKNADIPYSVTSLGEGTFKECPSLKSVFIPDTVTDIGFCSIGYKDSYIDNDGVMVPDGGYEPVGITIEGYKGSAAEHYVKEEISFFNFKARTEEYKTEVLSLLNIPEEDPEDGTGWLAYYSENYRYRSESSKCEATPDYVLITAYTNEVGPMFAAELLGDYILRDSNYHFPATFGYLIYLPKTNEIYSLEKAYELQIVGIENVFTKAGVGELLGDVNYDRKLNIKDATLIQKAIAGLAEIENNEIGGFLWNDYENVPTYIADFNCDRKMNVRDATAIQKRIAGL